MKFKEMADLVMIQIFKPKGINKTFAELSFDEKNKISHRAIAIKKLIDYFNKLKS